MRIQIFMITLMGIFLSLLLGCTKSPDTPNVDEQTNLKVQPDNEAIDLSEISPEAKELFERLNSWSVEEIDVFECPDSYPGRITSGETNAWISTNKDKLKELGFIVEWNCDTKVYELFKIEQ